MVGEKLQCNHIKDDGERCQAKKLKKNIPKEKQDNWKCHQHRDENPKFGGREPKYKTVKELQKAINDYFDSCFVEAEADNGEIFQKQIRPFTITGLAYHLGMTRKGLLDYEAKSEAFRNTIRRAKTRVEMYAEEQLFRSQGKTNGVQFNLKNNFNWKDKREHDVNQDTTIEVNIED